MLGGGGLSFFMYGNDVFFFSGQFLFYVVSFNSSLICMSFHERLA